MLTVFFSCSIVETILQSLLAYVVSVRNLSSCIFFPLRVLSLTALKILFFATGFKQCDYHRTEHMFLCFSGFIELLGSMGL